MVTLRGRIILGFALLIAVGSRFGPASAQEKAAGGNVKAAAKANDLYFMLLLSQERDPLAPRFSHTYAAFVRAQRAAGEKDYRLETHSISWLPATLDIRLLRRAEPGVNLSLKASLDLSKSLETRISMWGPFQIQKELYDRALRQEAKLNRRGTLWKAADGAFRQQGEAVNCFHAVSDIDTDRGLLETGTAHGDAATEMVAQHLRRWVVDPERTHDWVADRLGLKKYSITQRKMTTGAIAESK
jgi:hypothetical protein